MTNPHYPVTGATAVRPEDVLPDDTDHTDFDGVAIRKGTIAAFLQNAMRWSDPAVAEPERQELMRAIVESLPALRAVGLFDVLEVRDERLRKILAGS